MAAITWRNVDAPTATGASRILDAAGRSMNKGIGQLSNLANQFGNIQEGNRVNRNKINTQDSLSQIAGLGSFADLEAARASNQFGKDQLPQGVDMQQIMKALQNQGSVIDDRLSKSAAFESRELGRAEKGTRIDANNALSSGNLELAAELNAGLVDQSGINSGIRQQQNAIDAKAKAEQDRLRGIDQQAAAATLNFQREQSNITLQDELEKARITAPLSPQNEATAIDSEYKAILNMAPNKPWFGTDNDSGGRQGQNKVRKLMSTFETDLGRKVTAAEMSQARSMIAPSNTGTDGEITSMDASFSPNDYMDAIREITGVDIEASNRVRRKAAKRGKNQSDLANTLDKIRSAR